MPVLIDVKKPTINIEIRFNEYDLLNINIEYINIFRAIENLKNLARPYNSDSLGIHSNELHQPA